MGGSHQHNPNGLKTPEPLPVVCYHSKLLITDTHIMHPVLNIARRTAISAGKIIVRYYENLDRIAISSKRANDLVSDVDLQVEHDIIQNLRRSYPEHAILSEETGSLIGDAEHQWLIDPLDGTTNYLHGLPFFCISMAYLHRQRLEIGLVYDPLREEFFTACRGQGAQLNGRRIRVTQCSQLNGALVSTGMPPWIAGQHQTIMAMMSSVVQQGGILRRTGSAALDLAYVASGRLDGFWETHLNPWDVGAGTLLVQEAGGLVSDYQGGHEHVEKGEIVAANPKLFKVLLQTLRQHGGSGSLA